jgi:hypothetical protein
VCSTAAPYTESRLGSKQVRRFSGSRTLLSLNCSANCMVLGRLNVAGLPVDVVLAMYFNSEIKNCCSHLWVIV